MSTGRWHNTACCCRADRPSAHRTASVGPLAAEAHVLLRGPSNGSRQRPQGAGRQSLKAPTAATQGWTAPRRSVQDSDAVGFTIPTIAAATDALHDAMRRQYRAVIVTGDSHDPCDGASQRPAGARRARAATRSAGVPWRATRWPPSRRRAGLAHCRRWARHAPSRWYTRTASDGARPGCPPARSSRRSSA